MLISYSHRFIFIHLIRTGGNSIRSALEPWACQEQVRLWKQAIRSADAPGHAPPPPRPALGWHPTAIKIRDHIPTEMFFAFFKFAFVRNTWDRLVSQYSFIMQKPSHLMHARVAALGGFDDYVALQTRRPSAPQKIQLTDLKGDLLVDFVGRFETLAADFQTVCDRLKIKAPLPHINASRHRDYRSHYTDCTAAMVEEAFRKEIDFFGFSFDDTA